VTLVLLVLVLAAGCATQQAARKGDKAASHNNWDAAVYYYLEALAEDPDNLEHRMALIRARQKAAQEHFHRGQALRRLGRLTAAHSEMQMAVQLDPTNQFAEQELSELGEELEILAQPGGTEALEEIKRRAREAKVKPPILSPQLEEPLTLSFLQPKPVKEIYKAISKTYGFNVTFDPKLKGDKLVIELNDVTAERALELVTQASQHFYKVLDEHSIIIAEDTPQNRRKYEDLVIKTFFLSNAEVKEVDKLLRSLIEAKRLTTNEQLNAISLRDTADKVAIAEKLIAVNDKARAEVLIDVELLQVNSNWARNIGAGLSAYAYGVGLDAEKAVGEDGLPSGTGDGLFMYLDDISEISRGDLFINIPSVIINLARSSGDAETLAQPQLRITEGEKASLVIGDEVPIPITTFNTNQATISGYVPITTSFQYESVGIKIDVEPRVHHNLEVTLRVSVEVSQLGETVEVSPEQEAITIGTRTITTVIRLKNGESSLLAGLLRVDKTRGRTKTPVLSDIPLIGSLFSSKSIHERRTDLILTLTPHIIRCPDIKGEDLAPIWAGTESKLTFFGNRPRVESGRSPTGPLDRGQRQQGVQRPIPVRQVPSTEHSRPEDGR
jgi:general secretion pathway protein D